MTNPKSTFTESITTKKKTPNDPDPEDDESKGQPLCLLQDNLVKNQIQD